jgi:pSer/pThr/pTyr-binding forkhead associated (FHA) protein
VWESSDGVVTFPLAADTLLVGRDEGVDVLIDEPLVSRQHARIERRGEDFRVVDLGSTNLTRLNGEPVREALLRHGDEVRFGRARCTFLEQVVEPSDDS